MSPLFGRKREPAPPAEPLRLTVISRRDCHLCDAMLSDLAYHLRNKTRRGEVVVETLDVDADDALRERYDIRVPVLLANGEHVCDYKLDLNALAPHLAAKLPPAGWERR
jgi:hypothetical protein